MDEDSTSDRYPYSGNNSSYNTAPIPPIPNQQSQYGGGGQGQYPAFRQQGGGGGGNAPSLVGGVSGGQYYGPRGGNDGPRGGNGGRGYPPGM